jgi:acyl-CoA synthetase (AMP-forming)/AMP-acid ligase II
MRDEGLGSWIERRARIAPNRPAVVSGETSRTYDELASRVRRLANGFRQLGMERGDRVGWLGPNHPAFLEALFASGKLGAVFSPVNHQLDQASIGRTLEDSGPRVVVIERSLVGLALPPAVQSRVVVGPGGENMSDS